MVNDNEQFCPNVVRAMAKIGVVTTYAADTEATMQMMYSGQEAEPYRCTLRQKFIKLGHSCAKTFPTISGMINLHWETPW